MCDEQVADVFVVEMALEMRCLRVGGCVGFLFVLTQHQQRDDRNNDYGQADSNPDECLFFLVLRL